MTNKSGVNLFLLCDIFLSNNSSVFLSLGTPRKGNQGHHNIKLLSELSMTTNEKGKKHREQMYLERKVLLFEQNIWYLTPVVCQAYRCSVVRWPLNQIALGGAGPWRDYLKSPHQGMGGERQCMGHVSRTWKVETLPTLHERGFLWTGLLLRTCIPITKYQILEPFFPRSTELENVVCYPRVLHQNTQCLDHFQTHTASQKREFSCFCIQI